MRKLNHTFTRDTANKLLEEMSHDTTPQGCVLTPKTVLIEELKRTGVVYMNQPVLDEYLKLLEDMGRIRMYRTKHHVVGRGVHWSIVIISMARVSESEFNLVTSADVYDANRQLREELAEARAQVAELRDQIAELKR